jgi:hypothetical protein
MDLKYRTTTVMHTTPFTLEVDYAVCVTALLKLQPAENTNEPSGLENITETGLKDQRE